MQSYVFHPTTNARDVLNTTAVRSVSNELYTLDRGDVRGTRYDVDIISAHDSKGYLHRHKDRKLVTVLSYLPLITSPEWPSFYSNLCIADALACDSYVARQLTEITIPEKLMILLDGCTDQRQYTAEVEKAAPLEVPVWSADSDPKYWDAFVRVSAKVSPMIKPIAKPSTAAIGIAFEPIGPLLAHYLQGKVRFLSLAYEPITSQYFDCRQNHSINRELGQLINIPGRSAVPQIEEAFTTYVDELLILVEHANRKESMGLMRFSSNASLFDRIFHTINKQGR